MLKYLLILVPLSLFAVLNIKPIDIGEKAGFSTNVALSLKTKRGNSDTDFYSGDTKIQYDNNKSNAVYLQLSGAYAKTSGIESVNILTLHLRDLQSIIDNTIVSEFFFQSQQNKFKSIQERDLLGTNIRFMQEGDLGKFYLGLGLYRERLFYLDSTLDTNEYNNRLNSYMAYSKSLSEDTSFTYLGYFQPKVATLDDYYITQELELNLAIYKKLSLKFKVDYTLDSNPATDRKKEDFSQITAFDYEF